MTHPYSLIRISLPITIAHGNIIQIPVKTPTRYQGPQTLGWVHPNPKSLMFDPLQAALRFYIC